MEPKTPFYSNWLFWVLVLLVFTLASIVYAWFAPFVYKPLILEVKKSGETGYVHIVKFVAPSDGFLVVWGDKRDQKDAIFESSPYIAKGTYMDFKIPFVVRDPNDTDFYSKLLSSGKFFVTFYIDDNHDEVYNDNNVSKDFFGRRLEVIVDSGKQL